MGSHHPPTIRISTVWTLSQSSLSSDANSAARDLGSGLPGAGTGRQFRSEVQLRDPWCIEIAHAIVRTTTNLAYPPPTTPPHHTPTPSSHPIPTTLATHSQLFATILPHINTCHYRSLAHIPNPSFTPPSLTSIVMCEGTSPGVSKHAITFPDAYRDARGGLRRSW